MALAVLKRPASKVATERASKAQKKPTCRAKFFWVPTTSDGTFNFADMWYREEQDEPEDEMEQTKKAMEEMEQMKSTKKKEAKEASKVTKKEAKEAKEASKAKKAFSPWRKLMKS